MDEMISLKGKVMSEEQAMKLACAEARRGAGFVSPNPQVGCVILSSKNQFLSKGHHEKYGGSHAEVNALKDLMPDQLQGAKIFVTLEPCAHEGKTPSCAKNIAKLPVAEVVFGLTDPNPLVAGQGAEILRSAGLVAREYQGDLKFELEQVCEHFLINFREQRPFLSAKVASSLDGQLALKTGESKWITGPEARLKAHELRAHHDAILVGQRTLEIDNPSLDVRHSQFPGHRNQVIVLLSSQREFLKKPEDMQIFSSHSPEEIFFLKPHDNHYERWTWFPGQQKWAPTQEPQIFEKSLKARLDSNSSNAKQSKTWSSVLIEGGAQVLSSFVNEMRLDRLYLFQAPILLGGASGKAWAEQVKIKDMDHKVRLRQIQWESCGSDLLITGRF